MKLANARAKGLRLESEFREILERHGYSTYRPPKTRYGSTDIGGWGDILAWKPGCNPLLVQIATNESAVAHRREARANDHAMTRAFILARFRPWLAIQYGARPGAGDVKRGWWIERYERVHDGSDPPAEPLDEIW